MSETRWEPLDMHNDCRRIIVERNTEIKQLRLEIERLRAELEAKHTPPVCMYKTIGGEDARSY